MGRTVQALTYEPARMDDSTLWADIYTAAQPERAVDPVQTRYEWEHPARNWVQHRFVVRDGERTVGVAGLAHHTWEKVSTRHASLGGEILPDVRDRGTLAELHRFLERIAIDDGAKILRGSAMENDPIRADALRDLGYRQDRASRRWQLDLVEGRERVLAMAEKSRGRMREQGITLLTLDRDPDPDVVRKLWHHSNEADQDIPTTLPTVEETLDDFVEWLGFPGIYRDRVWLARRGGEVLGLSVLEYPPTRGFVNTAWTATARGARGQGVARALKCETLVQAIGLGVDRVRTGNDGANDPILHINASMGYLRVPGRDDYLKDV
jgi:hypothetical protein